MQLQSDLPDVSPVIQTMPVVYTRIPDAVLLDARLTPGQLRIYAVIARRADRETATAFPSYSTIAEDAHVSRTSAVNGVKRLVRLGYLSKQARESGQGDPTSNLYTISGEGSQIFVLPRPNTASNSPQAAPNLDHRIPDFVPQAVQLFDRGGANSAPELDSMNKKKSNKTQENRTARERTREASEASASAAATADPELQKLLNDFQENIGALTAVAKQVIGELVEEHSADQVRKAIQEAVIYEKRSLAYVRRVLDAWRRNGRVIDLRAATSVDGGQEPIEDKPVALDAETGACWPTPGLFEAHIATSTLDIHDPAKTAWLAICDRLPEFSRMTRLMTPQSLIGNLLTVTTSDPRTYDVLANARRNFVVVATRAVLGDDGQIQIELIDTAVDATGSNARCTRL